MPPGYAVKGRNTYPPFPVLCELMSEMEQMYCHMACILILLLQYALKEPSSIPVSSSYCVYKRVVIRVYYRIVEMWIHFFFDFSSARPFLLLPILLTVSNLFQKITFQPIKESLVESIKQFLSHVKSREAESLLRSLAKTVSTEFYVLLNLCSGVEDFKPIIVFDLVC